MLKPTTLNELFTLLNEMTLAKHGENTFSPSKNFQTIEKMLITAYLCSLLILVSAAIYVREFIEATEALQVILYLYLFNLALSIAYLVTITLGLISIFWKQRKTPYSAIMYRLSLDMQGDADFLKKLYNFEKHILEYGLIQYRQSWGISENRVFLLAGNLRNLGLFPALAAASIGASKLIQEGSSLPLWLPIILAAVFSIMGAYALGQRERPQQVIELLEYAVQHSKERTLSRNSEVDDN
ncbi:hypothetical protein LCGC14_0154390 [marine sediment metagenome]|uniref:Uncharacterized protein n=1 Tax=marine sediment metagenome TaxID=412755 RepID=A0A0F9VCZ0_9ZZZZ|nr:hypothetical protein [Halomonas sp.]HDZ47068.1 hypothetical protein [Halomonas sp.]HEB06886.1 hypothetical protein [Halomonas sp.]